jgi:hypothetical protein
MTGLPRLRAVFDTECTPNYWLLKLRPIGGATLSFEIRDGAAFTVEQTAQIERLFQVYAVVSFNGMGYDVPMLRGVLAGFNTAQLKELNDRIIVDKVKPWELGMGEWVPADHIDIMQVCPGAGSQKQYAGRIHHKTMRDLPYDPGTALTHEQMAEVAAYCENDLDVLLALFNALAPQLRQRERLGARYGIDLRSKSDAQVAEAIIRKRCETAVGRRIYKPTIDWSFRFRCNVPDFISFTLPQLQRALDIVRNAVFRIQPPASMRYADGIGHDDVVKGKCVVMPPELEGLTVVVGQTVYQLGIGGLHSQEKRLVAVSDDTHILRMPDVTAYYPNLIVNSRCWPPALGPTFQVEYTGIKEEREVSKAKLKTLKAANQKGTVEYADTETDDGGGKIQINGLFGKTGSPYSVAWAPEMLINTTLPGQLSLLMLIEWMEAYGIRVISANTDGLVLLCPRDKVATCDWLIAEWEKRTSLRMEMEDYRSLYARDVNSYYAIPVKGETKRKGEYAKAGLVEKKNPDVEICSDAVAAFLSDGTPIEWTIITCTDIRKFVTIQKVNGGGVKMWGDGPIKGELVRDLVPRLHAMGWVREGRKWTRWGEETTSPAEAYAASFPPRRPEHLGKVVRWYYGKNSPGPIVYATNGNWVGSSYGARPCMTLPDTLPDDIDYNWYIAKARAILNDVGFDMANVVR